MPKIILEAQIDDMVDLYLAGKTPAQISKAMGLVPKTIYKYLKNEEFLKKLNSARDKVRKVLFDKAVSSGDVALTTLVDICQDPEASNSNKISAAGKILDFLKSVPLVGNTENNTTNREYSVDTLDLSERKNLRTLIQKCAYKS